MDRSPTEIVGRPKWSPPVQPRTKWHRKTVAMCKEPRALRPQQPIAIKVVGKPVAMRSRKTVTAWSQDREAGRCQVNGSHLMLRALHHLLDAEFPLKVTWTIVRAVFGGKVLFPQVIMQIRMTHVSTAQILP